mgnify:FL=1
MTTEMPKTIDLPAMQAAREARAAACLEALERELERANDWLGRSQMPWDSLIYQQHFEAASNLWIYLYLARWFEKQTLVERFRISLRNDFKLWGRSQFWIVKELSLGWQRGGYEGLLLPGEAAWALYMGDRALAGVLGNESTSAGTVDPLKKGW